MYLRKRRGKGVIDDFVRFPRNQIIHRPLWVEVDRPVPEVDCVSGACRGLGGKREVVRNTMRDSK